MRAVNLLKGSTMASGRSKPPVAVFAAGAAPLLAIALVAVGYTYEHSSVTSARGKLAAVQAEVAAIPQHTATPEAGTLELELQQSQRRTELAAALAYRIAWDTTLVQIERILPSDVWLTQLNLTSPEPADATTAEGSANPEAFSVEGYTYSQNDVAQFITRLQLLPILSNITLASSGSNAVGTKAAVEFTLNAQINGPVTAQPASVSAATTTTSST